MTSSPTREEIEALAAWHDRRADVVPPYRETHGLHIRTSATLRALLARAEAAEAMGVPGEIAAERRRQIEVEGWSSEHDDTHSGSELAMAAACYALLGSGRSVPAGMWPWRREGDWPKPKSKRRDLIRAAALIVAEIERLDRAALAGEAGRG